MILFHIILFSAVTADTSFAWIRFTGIRKPAQPTSPSVIATTSFSTPRSSDTTSGFVEQVDVGSNTTVSIEGVNLNITATKDKVMVLSPVLLWSASTAFINIKYTLVTPIRGVLMWLKILCYSDLAGKKQIRSWISRLYLSGTKVKTPLEKCAQVINPERYDGICTTYRLVQIVSVPIGLLTISHMSFGDEALCRDPLIPPTTIGSDFEDGDGGVRNNLCGLADWMIQENIPEIVDNNINEKTGSSTCPTEVNKNTGFPLPKSDLLTNQCFYPICIQCLQPSGFHLVTQLNNNNNIGLEPISAIQGRRQAFGRSIILDPAGNLGQVVGPAVLDLPIVTHDPLNAFFTFQFQMVRGGLHTLAVYGVCTARPSNDIIPLAPRRLHFRINQFTRLGRGGIVCLDIHSFVTSDFCPTFAIQMSGAALDTAMIVDNIFFVPDLASTTCSGIANSS
jgi:hypothetical protein